MSAVIKPTIGRVVHYRPGANDSLLTQAAGEPLAAIVCGIHGPNCVSLCVFTRNGSTEARTSVPMVQDGEEPPTGGHCHWMPFQIGQAQRTEEAEKALAEAAGETAAPA